jgi:hypothetical protein
MVSLEGTENIVGVYLRNICLFFDPGRAVAQAVSRWLPTAAARVRVRAA